MESDKNEIEPHDLTHLERRDRPIPVSEVIDLENEPPTIAKQVHHDDGRRIVARDASSKRRSIARLLRNKR